MESFRWKEIPYHQANIFSGDGWEPMRLKSFEVEVKGGESPTEIDMLLKK